MQCLLALALLASVGGCSRPVADLGALDGCYDGERGPKFLREPGKWILRISNGQVSDRHGQIVSRISIVRQFSQATRLRLSRGVWIKDDIHKEMTIVPGPASSAVTFRLFDGGTMLWLDDMMMERTSCD